MIEKAFMLNTAPLETKIQLMNVIGTDLHFHNFPPNKSILLGPWLKQRRFPNQYGWFMVCHKCLWIIRDLFLHCSHYVCIIVTLLGLAIIPKFLLIQFVFLKQSITKDGVHELFIKKHITIFCGTLYILSIFNSDKTKRCILTEP